MTLDEKAYQRRYRLAHTEELKAYSKKYRFIHAEEIRAQHKEYRLAHAISYKENSKRYGKQYRLDHKEKLKQEHRRYRLNHKQEIKRYYLNHKEEIRQKGKQRYLDHKEEVKQYGEQHYLDHKEEIKQRVKQYKQTPKGKANHQRGDTARRTKLSKVINTLTSEEWLVILEEHEFKCVYCGKNLLNLFNRPTRDHIIPVSKGGDNIKENIAPSCQSCNSRKHTKVLTKNLLGARWKKSKE
jgi:hypothetical protein